MRMFGRRLATPCLIALWLGLAPRTDAETQTRPAKVQHSIRGATQMFVAPWGSAAQGSSRLRILPRERLAAAADQSPRVHEKASYPDESRLSEED